jgi:hypothetical protein
VVGGQEAGAQLNFAKQKKEYITRTLLQFTKKNA